MSKKNIQPEVVYQALNNAGYKVTKARIQLIKILLKNQEYLTVSQILKKIPGSNVATIYNNIWLLEKIKIVDKISLQSKAYYQIPFDPNQYNKNIRGFYISKNNKISPIEIEDEIKSLKNKLEKQKISKITIYVSEK